MHANRRGGGLAAQPSARTDRTKYPPPPPHRFRRLDWARYRRFLRRGLRRTVIRIARLVARAPPAFRVRAPGTPGRTPTDPREVVRCLLFRSLHHCSYDQAHAMLLAFPDVARVLGVRRLPAAPPVAALAVRVPPPYLERLLGQLARRGRSHRVNLAGDGTGISTRRFDRWLHAKGGRDDRHSWVKLHALVETRAQFPVFFAAHVTDAYTNEVSELPRLLGQIPSSVPIGNVALDRGYPSRRNAPAIADRGGRPVIALRANVRATTTPDGFPAWKKMVVDQFHHRREFRCRYRRRSVIEGTFGARKARLGSPVRCRRRATQRVEVL
ncbi:MAG TPA: transposase, partial [Thermoplasmata archaeon]|nr:transposase [Thermoplasmata archaeon]